MDFAYLEYVDAVIFIKIQKKKKSLHTKLKILFKIK